MDKTSIQDSIEALLRVLDVHENHLFPKDKAAFEFALHQLHNLKIQGFK